MMKNKKLKKNWSEEDVKVLVWIVSKYADKHAIVNLQKDMSEQDWKVIASLIPGVTMETCLFKWLSLRKVNLAQQCWNEQQSKILQQVVETYKENHAFSSQIDWKQIASQFYNINTRQKKVFRSSKQCKEHWNCFLNPTIKKGIWKIEEDIKLLEIVIQNRYETKWSGMIHRFEGRTQNSLKNRFNLLIQKQRKINKSKQRNQLIKSCLQRIKSGLSTDVKTDCDIQLMDAQRQKSIQKQMLSNQQSQKPSTHQQTILIESHPKQKQIVLVDNRMKVVEVMNISKIQFCSNNFLNILKQFSSGNRLQNVKPGCLINGTQFHLQSSTKK